MGKCYECGRIINIGRKCSNCKYETQRFGKRNLYSRKNDDDYILKIIKGKKMYLRK